MKTFTLAFFLALIAQPVFAFGSKTSSSSSSSSAQSSSSEPSSSSSSSTNFQSVEQVAAASSCASYYWPGRGKAPAGYMKGLAVAYAKNYCDLKANNPAAKAMAASFGSTATDGLAYYGILPSTEHGRLRALFTFLAGLGMRESTGQYCEGTDYSTPTSKPGNEHEAGLYQTSYNTVSGPVRKGLFEAYRADQSECAKSIFAQGVVCTAKMLKNFGSGDAVVFQKLSKECPVYAVETAAINVRILRKHYGPINRKEVKYYDGCEKMFEQVENVIRCQ